SFWDTTSHLGIIMNNADFLETYSYDDPDIRLHHYYDNLMIIVPLVIGVCVSLPALIWAVHVLYTLRKQ
ncbi:Tetratricopeptide repeat protein 30B, partial [Clarias magur]